MTTATVAKLPVELLVHIFEYLDSAPASAQKTRHEPSPHLPRSTEHYLKDISCVSRRWRRIVLPLLFKHACLRMWRPERSTGLADGRESTGAARTTSEGQFSVHPYHLEVVEAMQARLHPSGGDNAFTPNGIVEKTIAKWMTRTYHILEDFLNFIETEKLTTCIQSITMLSDWMLKAKATRLEHLSLHEWHYLVAAALWQNLLSAVDPDRIVIIAPPTELACLMNAAIDTHGDW